MSKYHIIPPYFHIPNQFWSHKNHSLVIDALGVLKKRGRGIRVISTGRTEDPRQPDHYATLMEKVAENGLAENFISMGIVPFKDLMAIMWHAVAIINPSLFEGWSTTVEEAKSMGKKVILSDIPVHREQNPDRAVFVDPNDPEQLALAMERALEGFNTETEKKYAAKAKKDLPERRAAFGRKYQEIVMSTLHLSTETKKIVI